MNNDFYFNIKKERPEELFENVFDYFAGETLEAYAKSKSIMRSQVKITKRALEILNITNNDALILDAGCGPGFASIYLKELGFRTVALDLIKDFLLLGNIKKLNPILADMCFIPFRRNTFDAIISISTLQWIYKNNENQQMRKNFRRIVKTFYTILKPHGKVVFQFYPKNDLIMKSMGKLIVNVSLKMVKQKVLSTMKMDK